MPTSPQAEAMLERMMERSELRIECAAHDEAVHVAQAAGRLLETAYAWQQWSTSHRQLLGQIARQQRARVTGARHQGHGAVDDPSQGAVRIHARPAAARRGAPSVPE